MEKSQLTIPPKMKSKLTQFRHRIWRVKLIEGICAAVFGLLISYLVVFVLDRFYDTSGWLRTGLLLVGTIGLAVWLPWVCHRWIWGSRRMEQVARLLKINHPRLGDYLLGIIELVNQGDFQGNSESLTRAALAQAEEETAKKDFTRDVPYPKHRHWAWIAGVPLSVAVLLMAALPAAGSNTLWRWLMPWRDIDRFTFAQLQTVPDSMVVPLAEPVSLSTQLADQTRWKPDAGSAWIGDYQIKTDRSGDEYQFELPPFQTAGDVQLRIGDALEKITINPQPRPELQSLTAVVYLPDYLNRNEPLNTEIRGGGVSIVKGSSVALKADATRPLATANLDASPIRVDGSEISSGRIDLDQTRTVELAWQDQLGLSAKSPLSLKLRLAEDEAPTLTCRELEKKRVIMVKDVLSFQVDASDDFGIKTIGMEWTGEPATTSAAEPAKGEKIISAGNPYASDINEVVATFSPQREKIEPQTVKLKLFAEDYLPGRPRVYSQPYTIFVLSEDDHAIWMTQRLDEWFKKGLETYERERQLYKRNIELRNLTPEELDRAETRRQIESQATAEKLQSRRLKALTQAGEQLIKEAARNDQFGVDHLETLAEMQQRLQDIADNRMPSVADLLKKASQAAASPATNQPSQPSSPDDAKQQSPENSNTTPPKPSQTEAKGEGGAKQPKDVTSVTDNPELPGDKQPNPAGDSKEKPEGDQNKKKNKASTVSMRETSMDEQQPAEKKPEEQPASPGKTPQLRLPQVTVNDPQPKPGGSCPAASQMEEAVAAQEELLAEFQEIAEELQKLISNLKGSTFVKRLKAMSRRELVVAKDVTESSLAGFGEKKQSLKKAAVKRTKLIAKRQLAHAETLTNIENDLEAYANRVQQGKFKTVLAEMRKMDAIEQVTKVAARMEANQPGTSIAQAELLADTFDRWAEQLVGPG